MIPRVARARYPLSLAQERLYVEQQTAGTSTADHLCLAASIAGPLREDILRESLATVMRRQGALRTAFDVADDAPYQRVETEADTPWRVIDVDEMSDRSGVSDVSDVSEPSGVRGVDLQALRSRVAAEEIGPSFALDRAPLFRVLVVRCGPARHLLLVTMDHIIADGWSLGVLMRELSETYVSRAFGIASSLPVLPVQYVDYAVWDRERASGAERRRQVDFWRRLLADAEPTVLGERRSGDIAAGTNAGAAVAFSMPTQVASAVRAFCRTSHVTLYSTLLTAFLVLLAHRTGRHDLVVGTDVAGRDRPELEPLIGFFVNQIVIRASTSGNPTLADLTRRVHEVVLDALTCQDVPHQQVVHEVAGARRVWPGAPLFAIKFILQNTPRPHVQIGDLEIEAIDVERDRSPLDLTLSMWSRPPSDLEGRFTFRTDVLERPYVSALAEDLIWIIDRLSSSGEDRLMVVQDALSKRSADRARDAAARFRRARAAITDQ